MYGVLQYWHFWLPSSVGNAYCTSYFMWYAITWSVAFLYKTISFWWAMCWPFCIWLDSKDINSMKVNDCQSALCSFSYIKQQKYTPSTHGPKCLKTFSQLWQHRKDTWTPLKLRILRTPPIVVPTTSAVDLTCKHQADLESSKLTDHDELCH